MSDDFDIGQQKLFLKTVGRFVRDEIRKAVEPLKERIQELEMTGIKFVGTYQRAQTYRRGNVVNHEGGMWVCTCDTPPHELPSKSVCWQLSVKSYSGKNTPQPRQPTQNGSLRPHQQSVERRP
jgi:hypothetical protein